MAQSASSTARYPLPVYNFRVTIDGVAMSFAKVSGINVQYETVNYRHGLSFWEGAAVQSFNFGDPVTVTFERGIAYGSSPMFLYDWLKKKDNRTVEVSLCDKTGTPLISWRIEKALPVKLAGPSFDASSNQVSVESLELTASGVSVVQP